MDVKLKSLTLLTILMMACSSEHQFTRPADDDTDLFASPWPQEVYGNSSIVLRPASRPVRILLETRWDDVAGHPYYPSVNLQYRAWNDDTTFAWHYVSLNEFSVRGDTIIVHPEIFQVIDYQMNGANFSFRARLYSAGIATDWIRLPESIHFFSEDKPGIPRQPRALRLLSP